MACGFGCFHPKHFTYFVVVVISGLSQHDHARKVCATILQTVTRHERDVDIQHQFGKTKLFLTEHQVGTDWGAGGREGACREGSLTVVVWKNDAQWIV